MTYLGQVGAQEELRAHVRVGKITAPCPVLLAMSVSTVDATLVSKPFGRFRLWLDRLRPRSVPVHDELADDAPLEQLLVHSRWKPASSRHPERAKVLGLIQSELSEASRLLAAQSGRDCPAERELKALLLQNVEIRTVDQGWELAARLRRLNLRIGRFDRAYVQSLLEYESAHAEDPRHWHTWSKHFRKQELLDLLQVYASEAVESKDRDRAVERLNSLYLKRAEAGRDRRAKAALTDLYLQRLTLVLGPFLLGLGTIALVSTTDSHSVWRAFAVAALAGALGSTLSGVLRLRDQLIRMDELRAFKPAMIVQPLVGASAGALVFLLLASRAFSLGSLDPEAWPSPGVLGFAAGFSEPFFLGLVDRVAGLPAQRTDTTPAAPTLQTSH
jgi:hypothetical protein